MDFKYTLIKTNRKTVALEISPEGTLIVRAPLRYFEKDADNFVKEHKKWILKHLPSILLKNQEVSLLSDNDIALAKKCIKIICSHFVGKYAPLMKVCPKNIKVTSAKRSFGSCSGKDNICFSYFLMLYPIEAIIYVVVHELSHIKHHNHSSSFHNYLEKYLPEAKKYEKLLEPAFAKHENFIKNVEFAEKLCLK